MDTKGGEWRGAGGSGGMNWLENIILNVKFMVFKLFCFKCQGCSPVSSIGLIKAVREIENRNEIKYDIWKDRAEYWENSHPSLENSHPSLETVLELNF